MYLNLMLFEGNIVGKIHSVQYEAINNQNQRI